MSYDFPQIPEETQAVTNSQIPYDLPLVSFVLMGSRTKDCDYGVRGSSAVVGGGSGLQVLFSPKPLFFDDLGALLGQWEILKPSHLSIRKTSHKISLSGKNPL